ncbi:MAG TPA: GNAT family N-acetyltransferase [Silvibacterium sp.]|nr:GNAT family N-acetyltransferase [Silvibacterium sp.]
MRPVSLDDAEQVQAIFPRWEIVRYLTDQVPWPFPPDGVLTFYRDIAIPAMERGDAWRWTLRLRTNPGTIIGSVDLTRGDTNRGFWLDPAHQRQGLMLEASNCVTDFWFNVLEMPVMRVPKAVDNTGSRRISEKQGMRMVSLEDRDYVSGRLPSEIWEITREEWLARKGI